MPKITPAQLAQWQITSDRIKKGLRQVVLDRDELGLQAMCDECLATLDDPQDQTLGIFLGTIKAYKNKDAESFEWLMYAIARVNRFDEILARFWIATWQTRMNGSIPIELE
jgi:hypothetical protein